MIYGNEPISPTPIAGGDNSVVSIDQVSYTSKGLTIRQHFASLAMQACRSRSTNYKTWEDLAKDSVEIADALIAELNK